MVGEIITRVKPLNQYHVQGSYQAANPIDPNPPPLPINLGSRPSRKYWRRYYEKVSIYQPAKCIQYIYYTHYANTYDFNVSKNIG